jgi:hypothetical protein
MSHGSGVTSGVSDGLRPALCPAVHSSFMKTVKALTLKPVSKSGKVAAKTPSGSASAGKGGKTPAKSAAAKKAAASHTRVVKLVHQFPPVDVKPAPSRPQHLSPAQMSAMLKIMKIA